jgi:hypothetical protein
VEEQYGGLEVSEAKRLRALEEKTANSRNCSLKAIWTSRFEDVLSKNVAPVAKREVANHLVQKHQLLSGGRVVWLECRRAVCAIKAVARTTFWCADASKSWPGATALWVSPSGVLLRREGHLVNLKRVLRCIEKKG